MMPRAAALDLGSNSFHLLVADVHSRQLANAPGAWIDRVATRKTTLRLGERVTVTGEVGDAADRVVEAVEGLVSHARREGAQQLVCVATSALREANDRQAVCQRLRAEAGVDVRLLDGLDEGALSLRGMRAALQVPDGDAAVGLDLGGGSHEVVASTGASVSAGTTLPLGTAHVAFSHDPPWLAERAELFHRARGELAEVAAKITAAHGAGGTVIGTAGTIRDAGRVALALATGKAPKKVRGLAVTREQLERAAARLAAEPVEERADIAGASRKRADLLPAGSIVLLATLDALGAGELRLCHWGVREGALLDALGAEAVVGPGALQPLDATTHSG